MSETVRTALRRPEGPVWLALAGATMAQTWLAPGVLASDLALAAAMAWATALVWATRERPRLPAWGWPLVGLVAWAAVAAAFLYHGSPLPFSPVELAKSLAKLCLYAAAVLCLAQVLAVADRRRLAQGVLWIVALNALVGLYIYAVMATGAPLPYRFLWAGTGQLDTAAVFVRSGQEYLRLRGVAAEPSYFGYLQVLALTAAVLLWPRVVEARWRLLAAMLSILLTFSLTTYALAMVAALAVLAAHGRELAPRLRTRGLAAGACLLLVVALAVTREAVSEMIVQRGLDVLTGRSLPLENSRLAGSWEGFRLLAGASPVLGVGLGNYEVALEGVASQLDPRLGSRGQQGWNALGYAGATLGIPGLLLLLALIVVRFRHAPAGAALLLAATFANGTWLGSPFWLAFLLLGAAPRRRHGLDDEARGRRRQRPPEGEQPLVGQGREQRQGAAGGEQRDRDPGVGRAGRRQTLIEVAAVGGAQLLAPLRAHQQRPGRIEQEERHARAHHQERVRPLPGRGQERQARQ